jgi:hypothetical protein
MQEYEIIVTEDVSSWIIKRRYRQFHALNEYVQQFLSLMSPFHSLEKQKYNNHLHSI